MKNQLSLFFGGDLEVVSLFYKLISQAVGTLNEQMAILML